MSMLRGAFKSRVNIKIMLALLLCIVLPMILVFSYTNSRVTNQMMENIRYANEHAFQQAEETMALQFNTIGSTVKSVLGPSSLHSLLSMNYVDIRQAQLMEIIVAINREISSISNIGDVEDALLYLKEDHPLLGYSVKYSTLDTAVGLKHPVPRTGPDSSWCLWKDKSGAPKLSLFYNFYSGQDYSARTGVLRVDMDTSIILNILSNAASSSDSQVFFLNEEDKVLLYTDHDNPQVEARLSDLLGKEGAGSAMMNLGGEQSLVSALRSGATNWYLPKWTLLSVTPMSSVQAPVNQLMTNVLFMVLLCTLTFYGCACMFSLSLTSRINQLTQGVHRVQAGDFDIMISPRGQDEITELTVNLNYMAKRISILLNERTAHMNQLRENELIALKAQINPHFLYNTLDMINWAAANHVPEISETVRSLSRFYKLSLSKGKNIVPLCDELAHVSAYMDIQQRRYDGIFQFSAEVPPELYSCSILKITLQPLVENSILHGILQKEIRGGEIRIRAWAQEDMLFVSVYDNGVGLSYDQPEYAPPTGLFSKNSYGLLNINNSLQLCYGPEYGLKIRSRKNCFTEVLVLLPQKAAPLSGQG